MNVKLRAARERSGKTQAQVAKETGVTERAYQYYESDEKEPGVRTAIRIADVLGVEDLRKLFGDSISRQEPKDKEEEKS